MSFIQRMRVRVTCLGLGLLALSASPGIAAERVIVRLGPLRQSIELSDLETFAETGEVPEQLKLYERFLSPALQQSLRQELDLDPRMSDRIIEDVLASANGELLLDTLNQVAPNVTIPQIQAAIRLAASQADGLNMIDILRAIPQETLEVDVTQAVALVSQLNLSNLESRSLSGVLDQELRVDNPPPIRSDIQPELPGSATVFQQAVSFEDRDRDRTIPVELYWTGKTKGPLVVLSHGFGADRFFLDYIGKHLASHGLTVVSVEHPGSNLNTLVNLPVDPEIAESPSRILPAQEFLDRPKDISFVLDQLERLNRRSVFYRERFRTQEVTMIGHSLGGYTGLALAGAKLDLRSLESFCKNIQPLGVSPADWLQCAAVDLEEQQADLTDGRIQQVIAMNTLTGQLFGEAGLSEVRVPTLLLTGTKDSVTPTLDQQLNAFTQLSGEKYLLAVIGGTHLSVGDPGNVNPALTELPFMAELKVEETANLRLLLQGISLSFVKQQTDEAADYKPFLSSTYVQSFSTPALPLRLVETLPDSVRSWLVFSDRISAHTTSPTLTSRLMALGYLSSLDKKEEWQKAITAQLQANQVVTVLRSPLPFIAGW
ncbi:alpha/beta hydrolase [cf. Phormidesmis sp. LEGE 11477]|uniref:alpha/beta hydrolase n=1 Tax=cf. Phormidesmis sp. LEGE 11477 TaxID=1828680 RepID=UPI001D147D8B|nr:alpha/beta hydrolase [cf. Phormidesmis sp. LEGE 11477]